MSNKYVTIFYKLSEKGRKVSLLNGGTGKTHQHMLVPVSKELLDLESTSVDSDGEAKLYIGKHKGGNSPKLKAYINHYYNGNPYIDYDVTDIEFDHIPSYEELILWETNRLKTLNDSLNHIENEYKLEKQKYELKQKEEQEIKDKKIQQEKEIKEQQRLLKEKEKEDDINWIKEYGSERLKLCLDMNYECKRLYIQERTERDFPEFKLDFDDNSSWQERVSPSLEALKEAKSWIDKGFKCEIVWLTESVHGSEYDYENGFERCEALALKFRGYWLVKEM